MMISLIKSLTARGIEEEELPDWEALNRDGDSPPAMVLKSSKSKVFTIATSVRSCSLKYRGLYIEEDFEFLKNVHGVK